MAYPMTLTITNVYDPETAVEEKVFNTGLAALETGVAVVADDSKGLTFKAEHDASIRLYDGVGNSNSYVTLKPQEAIEVEVADVKEHAYYTAFAQTGFITVEEAFAPTPVDDDDDDQHVGE